MFLKIPEHLQTFKHFINMKYYNPSSLRIWDPSRQSWVACEWVTSIPMAHPSVKGQLPANQSSLFILLQDSLLQPTFHL